MVTGMHCYNCYHEVVLEVNTVPYRGICEEVIVTRSKR